MEILYPPTLISAFKNKHVLLDTNIFIDSLNKPVAFRNFFSRLLSEQVTLSTIDLVKYELLIGSSDQAKYQLREQYIKDITEDYTVPITPKTYDLIDDLMRKYGIDGAGVEITDLFLGAIFMQYKSNIFLMSKDTSAFIQRIFELVFILNHPHSKGIYTYGVYQYTQ